MFEDYSLGGQQLTFTQKETSGWEESKVLLVYLHHGVNRPAVSQDKSSRLWSFQTDRCQERLLQVIQEQLSDDLYAFQNNVAPCHKAKVDL